MICIFLFLNINWLITYYLLLTTKMHTLEPYWKWRDYYTAEEDEKSPFYGREYSEFEFSDKI